jgi:type 1 fimbriae regulatory protein FimB/type 1 fimbriae regulatory protein FimE
MPTNGTDRSNDAPACGAPDATGAQAPITVNGTVENTAHNKPPTRRKNTDLRPREFLTEAEVDKLQKHARKRGRYGVRDAGMILLAYRHALRVSELCALRWEQIGFDAARIDLVRSKNGNSSPHPLCGDELRLLRQIKRDSPASFYVFCSERGGPISAAGFRKLLARTGQAAGFDFGVHPHMLRHACGYKLANDGRDTRTIQDYLGHKNIQHTVRYTQLSAQRFKGLWKE